MLIAVLFAVALWQGGAVAPVVAGVAALRFPAAGLAGVVGWVAWHRFRVPQEAAPDDEARLFDRLVAELDGGSSPRAALDRVARRGGPIDLEPAARMVAAGLDGREVAVELERALVHNGQLAAAAWTLAVEAGAPAGPVMRSLAHRARARGRLDRERRTLTAQARATAWLIAGVPMVACALLVATGRIRPGPALPVVLAGALMQLVGLGIAAAMIRRAA